MNVILKSYGACYEQYFLFRYYIAITDRRDITLPDVGG